MKPPVVDRALAVIFDMDGVIFDTEKLYFESETELLGVRGREFTIDLGQRMMGLPALEAMELLRREHDLTESAADLVAECRQRLLAKIETRLDFMPGFLALLVRIESTGRALAVATSTHRELTEHMLGRFDLRSRFAHVVTSDDVANGKPDPEIYRLTCDRLGAAPATAVVFEDSYNGVLSATRAGCRCVAVPHALTRSLDFSRADLIVDDLQDRRIHELLGLGE